MKRIVLFVDHASDVGGAERSLLMLMEELRSHDWRPHLVCASEVIARAAVERQVPAVVIELPRLRRSTSVLRDLFRGARAIGRESSAIDAGILHANTLRAAGYTAVAARWTGRPFVWHMRDFSMSESMPKPTLRRVWMDRLEKRSLSVLARRIVCNSSAVAASFPPSSKIEVVRNGLDVRDYDPEQSGDAFRRQFGIPSDACLVGTIGRLRRWKGHERFIRVAARVAAASPNARFLVAGGNPLEPDERFRGELEGLAAELGLGSRLTFTGQLADVRPALAALDVFVHCGDPEPFGLVNIEAMSMAVPVVAFAHGALPEIVVHEETGFLVPSGDEMEMARVIVELLLDTGRRRGWGQCGRAHVEAHFTIARVAEEIVGVYEGLVRGPS